MQLNDHEALLIASLADNTGFHLLLEALKADSDDLLDAIERAETDEQERRLCAEWKALRRVMTKLRDLTQYFKASVDESVEALGANLDLFSVESNDPSFFGKLVAGED